MLQILKNFYLFLTCYLIFSFFMACAPIRKPIPIGEIPKPRILTQEDEQYGHTVLNGLSENFKLDYDTQRVTRVRDIVDRLTKAAGVSTDPWHVYVFDDQSYKNAAATRGNHVFVWRGLIDLTASDDELATVISHEIAHVLAGHTDPDPNEELTHILVGLGATAAGIAASAATKNPQIAQTVGDITSNLTGAIGGELLIFPYSRSLEYEADQIGLMVMTKAGYNPNAAVSFWQKALNDPDIGSSNSMPYFSTHPPAADRLERLKQLIPMAQERYGHTRNNLLDKNLYNQDSFAINTSTTNHFNNQWKVISPKAILYDTLRQNKKALGEFKMGTIITSINETKNWVEINSPDHGFLRKQDLSHSIP